LTRARGEADVTRILLIGGDVALTKGPFRSSLDVAPAELIEARASAP